jgi:uncharacterized phage protein (TIGR01671 family)
MSRVYKFRAWDNFNKIMMYSESYISVLLTYALKGKEPPNGILMQFTGLKDKNGKEIYEGDIIICLSRVGYCPDGCKGGFHSCGIIAGIVEWYPAEWCLVKAKEIGWIQTDIDHDTDELITKAKKCIEFGDKNLSLSEHSYFEIIGNIYENPELLPKD